MGEYAEKVVSAPVHPGRRPENAPEIPTNEILQAYREGNLNRSFPPIGFPAERTPGQVRASRQAPVAAVLQRYEQDMRRHAPEAGAHTPVLQGKLYKKPSDMKDLVESQRTLQGQTDDEIAAALEPDRFTTVGFEHEFGQLNDDGSVLHNLTHLELAQSEKFGYSGLPFSLETDAADAIELVSPPFIMTANEHGVPETADVVGADNMIRAGLANLLARPVKFRDLKTKFAGDLGIRFAGQDVKVKNYHVKPGLSDALKDQLKPPAPAAAVPQPEPSGRGAAGTPPRRTELAIPAATVDDLEIKLSKKGGGITSQANIAMDAEAYFQAKKAVKSRIKKRKVSGFRRGKKVFKIRRGNKKASGSRRGEKAGSSVVKNSYVFTSFTAIQKKIIDFIKSKFAGQTFSKAEQSLLGEIATNLSQCLIIVPMTKLMEEKEKIFQGDELGEEGTTDYDSMNKFASFVKDVSGVWFKDTILSLCAGVLKDQAQKDKFKTVFGAVKGGINSLHDTLREEVNGTIWKHVFGSRPIPDWLKYDVAMKDKIDASIGVLLDYFRSDGQQIPDIDRYDRPEFMGYNPALLGGRQDTFIPQSKMKKAPAFADRRMYVVEVRNHDLEASLEAIRTGKWRDTPAAASPGTAAKKTTKTSASAAPAAGTGSVKKTKKKTKKTTKTSASAAPAAGTGSVKKTKKKTKKTTKTSASAAPAAGTGSVKKTKKKTKKTTKTSASAAPAAGTGSVKKTKAVTITDVPGAKEHIERIKNGKTANR